MTLTRDQAAILLEPKLSNIWLDAYQGQDVEYTQFVNVRVTKKATITDAKLAGLGPMRLKGEGENITYDDVLIGGTVAYTPVRWSLGYKVTQEMIDHELYGQVEKFERGLIKSAIDLQETTAALALNNGFGTTNGDGFTAAGFDGLALFSVSHTRLDNGPVWRNRPSTDIDLSVTGVQNAIIDIDRWVDDRGRPIKVKPTKVLINPEDRFTAEEIFGSELKPGTANNEKNALKGALSYSVLHYLTDADAWYVLTDSHDINFIWDVKPRTGMQEDFEQEVIKRKMVQGFAVGHGEARGAWGTNGG